MNGKGQSNEAGPFFTYFCQMISSRSSEDYLHTEVILNKITEYDIFRHYCSNFKELGVKFKSELREDNHPSCSIIEWNKGLLYKDFACEEHTFNCFSYVMYKYSIDFISSLKTISRDFGLGLDNGSTIRKATTYSYSPTIKTKTVIKIKRRSWEKHDAEFWGLFCISKKLLCRFEVQPLQYYWINEIRFRAPSHCYSFHFDGCYKIYSPYETDYKWYSNVDRSTIQGLSQLDESRSIVFLTSSLKDVMCLEVLGYSSIALQSEMQMPSEELIQNLKNKFQEVVVFYDNDFESDRNPGQKMAHKISNAFGIKNVFIPEVYCSKDISDLVKNRGVNVAKQVIQDQLWNLKNNKSTQSLNDAPF